MSGRRFAGIAAWLAVLCLAKPLLVADSTGSVRLKPDPTPVQDPANSVADATRSVRLKPDHPTLVQNSAFLTGVGSGFSRTNIAVSPRTAFAQTAAQTAPSDRALVARYCAGCHSERMKSGDLVLDPAVLDGATLDSDVWERVVRKLRGRMMPPPGAARPDEATYQTLVSHLETRLDQRAGARPDPGRTDPFRRMNRTEYRNAIHDLLDLDIDVKDLLPGDDASFGFDNISVTGLSPMLMERYLSAAQKISRLAVGSPLRAPASRVVILPPDLTQEKHVDGLPFGTRGGGAFHHDFPVDGVYTLRVQLSRDRNENVEGLTEAHEIEVALDGQRLQVFTVTPNRNRYGQYYADEGVDSGLELKVPVKAGPHVIVATFLEKDSALIETEKQPFQSHFNMDRHPRIQPAVRSLSIAGPFEGIGLAPGSTTDATIRLKPDPTKTAPTNNLTTDTPSRRRIFVCRPANVGEETSCARTIVETFARRAYRRPVTDADLSAPFSFYKDARATGSFETGIEMALRAMLTSPEFLFRVERDPAGLAAGQTYRISDIALASRLSFFLWSSIPDGELLNLAEHGELSKPAVLERQVRRMLADRRAESLTTNFASQWLYLRNLAAVSPDARLFPDFDDNLRQAMQRETELLFANVVSTNRPITELLNADYTFLNERLAKHYGITGVYGDRFRRVSLVDHPERQGVLGHGSVLTVTSYATRTSPVLRGKWILDNIIGMPPPPPPPTVPPLKDPVPGAKNPSMRERMSEHRANPACASCHQLMDPAGLSLENFDAVGRWRSRGDNGDPLDVSGAFPGGASFAGIVGLRQTVLARPDLFVGAFTEKLLTYGLGRGLVTGDAPAVRAVVRRAGSSDYRFESIILSIVNSVPFQMRVSG